MEAQKMLFKRKTNKETNKVILIHHGPSGSLNFDVFYPKNFKIEQSLNFEEYEMSSCPYVQESGLKEYYRFSGDLDHLPNLNKEIAHSLNKLIKDYGFTVVFAEDGWVKEEKKNE